MKKILAFLFVASMSFANEVITLLNFDKEHEVKFQLLLDPSCTNKNKKKWEKKKYTISFTAPDRQLYDMHGEIASYVLIENPNPKCRIAGIKYNGKTYLMKTRTIYPLYDMYALGKVPYISGRVEPGAGVYSFYDRGWVAPVEGKMTIKTGRPEPQATPQATQGYISEDELRAQFAQQGLSYDDYIRSLGG